MGFFVRFMDALWETRRCHARRAMQKMLNYYQTIFGGVLVWLQLACAPRWRQCRRRVRRECARRCLTNPAVLICHLVWPDGYMKT